MDLGGIFIKIIIDPEVMAFKRMILLQGYSVYYPLY
jgi:hypothetical protein